LPCACIDSAYQAIKIIETEPLLGENLLEKAARFYLDLQKAGFDLLDFESQIIPIIIGDNEKTLAFAKGLFDAGLFVKAIRPPTVASGSSRIRLSITLGHKQKDLDKAIKIMSARGKAMGLI
jgi:7-keto-8-aminopelargonate synthetase-like enzyme